MIWWALRGMGIGNWDTSIFANSSPLHSLSFSLFPTSSLTKSVIGLDKVVTQRSVSLVFPMPLSHAYYIHTVTGDLALCMCLFLPPTKNSFHYRKKSDPGPTLLHFKSMLLFFAQGASPPQNHWVSAENKLPSNNSLCVTFPATNWETMSFEKSQALHIVLSLLAFSPNFNPFASLLSE